MYSLHNLYKQFAGTQSLLVILKFSRFEITLKLPGSIVSHTTGPNDLKDCSPLYPILLGQMT